MFLFKKKKTKIKHDNIIAAIDIGSHKIAGTIFKIDFNRPQQLRCLAASHQRSKGIQKGIITNANSLEDPLLNTIYTIEQISKVSINGIYLSVPGNLLRSSITVSRLNLNNYAIDDSVIKKALTFDKKKIMSDDEEILHAIPINYQLDSIPNIKDPRKMVGNYLETTIHIITVPKIILNNLKYLLLQCDLELKGLMASSYAVGMSLLTNEEMNLGATVIDIGSDSTKISCFFNGNLVYIDNVNFGSAAITNDIAQGLNIPPEHAERLKIYQGFVSQERKITIPYNKNETSEFLQHIIAARIEELSEKIKNKFKSNKIESLWFSKIILTGGGSQLAGLSDYLSLFFQKEVHLRQGQGMKGPTADPIFSVCAGLIQCGYYEFLNHRTKHISYSSKNIWALIKNWFNEDL